MNQTNKKTKTYYAITGAEPSETNNRVYQAINKAPA